VVVVEVVTEVVVLTTVVVVTAVVDVLVVVVASRGCVSQAVNQQRSTARAAKIREDLTISAPS
jgi:hypothetical protein